MKFYDNYIFAGLQDLRFTKIYTAAHKIYDQLQAPHHNCINIKLAN